MGGGCIATDVPVGKAEAEAETTQTLPKEERFLDELQQLGVVVDRSGSMASMQSELVEGLNVFMEEQRKVGPAKVTVMEFDNTVDTVLDSVDLDQVPKFGEEHFRPRGMTALLDGIGTMIETMESRVPPGKLEGSAAPVIVILTDGQENASRTFNRKRIFDAITQKKALGWKITFMGANQDAIAVGESFGVDGGSCITYAATGEKQKAVWQATAAKVSRERFSSDPSCFSAQERLSSNISSAIDAACKARGGKYAEYSCKVVSWDDVARGTVGGSVSCWGANITDTYLKSKRGVRLFTVRADNWNEKLGRVSASEVALVSSIDSQAPPAPATLRDVLKSIGQRGTYAGLPAGTDLSDDALDTECSIRFQTTFLPVSGDRGTIEFATEAYNYNTRFDADPRNLIVLATTQGVAIQQDGAGTKRLFHHAVDPATGKTHRYWLEAERSDHKVGGAQAESSEERLDALARGKAVSSVIGTRAMGTRFNVLMTIQIPLEQQVHMSKPFAAAGAWCLRAPSARSVRRHAPLWLSFTHAPSCGYWHGAVQLRHGASDTCADFAAPAAAARAAGPAPVSTYACTCAQHAHLSF